MIAYVKGELAAIEESSVIIDNGGIGIRVFTPIREKLVRLGLSSQIQLFTYLNVREDAMLLYGFLTQEELELFKKLINVNGVGPKNAMAILSDLTVEQIVLAIAAEDKKTLNKVSGIGPKTAARIILDLKDKVSVPSKAEGSVSMAGAAASSGESGPAAEAVLALLALGYSQSEAAAAVRKVYQEGMAVEAVIKQSLQELVSL